MQLSMSPTHIFNFKDGAWIGTVRALQATNNTNKNNDGRSKLVFVIQTVIRDQHGSNLIKPAQNNQAYVSCGFLSVSSCVWVCACVYVCVCTCVCACVLFYQPTPTCNFPIQLYFWMWKWGECLYVCEWGRGPMEEDNNPVKNEDNKEWGLTLCIWGILRSSRQIP